MPQFTFSLQRILELRQQKEEQAQMALAALQRRFQEAELHLESLKKEVHELENNYRDKKTISQGDLWLWRQYRFRLDADIRESTQQVERLRAEVENQRQELVDRSKDRELMERFKDNRKKAFDYEQQKEEQKEFDETATARFQNKTL